jgi:hypothetical protein
MGMLVDFTGIVRQRFVETGTSHGNSLAEAAKVFEECLCIEQSVLMRAFVFILQYLERFQLSGPGYKGSVNA